MLTFVPTPIGNLGDISFRTLEVLKDGELILCEDTRVTKKLLSLLSEKYQIAFPHYQFISIHSHNEKVFLENQDNIILLKDKKCIYMSDAGMPCISDPGALLVQTCIECSIEYDVIPGANALLTAYAMSGFGGTSFSFYGFLPHKGAERNGKLQTILQSPVVSILYESPHRLLKLLQEIQNIDPKRVVFLAKEITKKYQTWYKKDVKSLYDELQNVLIKGEWVVLIEPVSTLDEAGGVITQSDILSLSLPPKQKAKLLSKITGREVKEIYQELMNS